MLTMKQARTLRAGKRLSGDRNQCAECGLLFNSTAAFDKHRVGSFGTGAGLPAARRCLSQADMQGIGMALNQAGFWVTERMTVQDIERKQDALVAQESDLETSGSRSEVVDQP